MKNHIERAHVALRVTDFMHRPSSVRAASEWVVFNEANRVLAAKGIPVLQLRYEDFVVDPPAAIAVICEHAGIATAGAGGPQITTGGVIELPPAHGLAGNPMRFSTGRVPIALDEAWRTKMHAVDRSLTTMLTSPWMRRYGYEARATRRLARPRFID